MEGVCEPVGTSPVNIAGPCTGNVKVILVDPVPHGSHSASSKSRCHPKGLFRTMQNLESLLTHRHLFVNVMEQLINTSDGLQKESFAVEPSKCFTCSGPPIGKVWQKEPANGLRRETLSPSVVGGASACVFKGKVLTPPSVDLGHPDGGAGSLAFVCYRERFSKDWTTVTCFSAQVLTPWSIRGILMGEQEAWAFVCYREHFSKDWATVTCFSAQVLTPRLIRGLLTGEQEAWAFVCCRERFSKDWASILQQSQEAEERKG
ncbi:hypothetical protein J1605_007238 [Eschrichtius robustus]|uniref:Uncharacterized protein n=1 Tax=Eschrichtius robustus TaxID=9764 RepID=A0AB34H1W3_ESCRO|nr:hypothetical protein J1605_007238 [Eschrichtius robustus]